LLLSLNGHLLHILPSPTQTKTKATSKYFLLTWETDFQGAIEVAFCAGILIKGNFCTKIVLYSVFLSGDVLMWSRANYTFIHGTLTLSYNGPLELRMNASVWEAQRRVMPA
jgi:hypothetical protein